jgi:predicted permease
VLDSLTADLRDAVRSLRRAPGATLVAVLTLGVGLGANVALFSVAEPLLVRPLPLPASDRLVQVWQTQPGNATRWVAPANFVDWRAQSQSFSGLAAYRSGEKALVGRGEPQRVKVATVSANFFDVLGRRVARGRSFSREEPKGPREAVLSEAFWRGALSGDPAVLGSEVTLDGESLVVVGVLEPGFALPSGAEIWTRARRDVPEAGINLPGVDHTQIRDGRFLSVLGRLKADVPLSEARAEMTLIGDRLRAAYPDANADTGVNLVPLQEQLVGDTRRLLLLLGGVVAFVLLIACVNLANLTLARAVRREREMAVRAALGAGRARLVRQMLTESLVLAVLGGLAGLGLALAVRPLLASLMPPGLPVLVEQGSSASLFAFASVAAVVAALLSGLAPALQASAGDLARSLRAGSRGAGSDPRRDRLRASLVTVQVALAVVLVAGASLLGRSVWRLQQAPLGFAADGALSLEVSVPPGGSRSRADMRALHARVIERLQTLPGVTAVGAIHALPLTDSGWSANVRVEGRTFVANEAPDVSWRVVSTGYFDAMKVPLRHGRGFSAGDGEGAPPVALVNETLARVLWPGEDPLGRRIGTGLDGDGAVATVVGVVGDTPQTAPRIAALPEMYRPLAQETRYSASTMSLVIRTAGAPVDVVPAVRRAIWEVDPTLPIAKVQPLSDLALLSTARERVTGALLALFGAIALFLAALGLYGVLSCLVSERLREFAVRMALGASPGQVTGLVLRRAMTLVVAGAAFGLVGALALSGTLGSLLFEIAPTDPVTHAGVVATLLGVGALAAWLPARRATRVDPILSLKED